MANYKETFSQQWRNLYSDFAQEYERLLTKGKAPGCFREWYETRIHRWRSVVYPEGMILDQEKNPEMTKALSDAMRDFHFEKVEPAPEKPLWQPFAVGLTAGIVSGVLMALLRWSPLRSVLSGAVVAIVVISGYLKSRSLARDAERVRVRQAYADQLKDYLPKLTAVCDSFQPALTEGQAQEASAAESEAEASSDGEKTSEEA